jgi:predicted nucleic acid-binding protein
MSVERRTYLDTSALARWYLEERGSNEFVAFLRTLDALHLVQAAHAGASTLATADIVMANAATKWDLR